VARGEAVDGGGPAVAERLRAAGFTVAATEVVPDEPPLIEAALRRLAARVALVATTGGTGLAARDSTPEATAAVAEYLVPGLAEEMRRAGREETPMAVLSRGVAGVLGDCLLLNLPGSPTGAVQSLEAVLPVLPHALALLQGDTDH
jgi:molybdenum cofactor synthesis domain-containing protein